MKTNKISNSLMREYEANIWKFYFFKFFKNFHFISAVLVPFFTLWGQISFSQIMILQAIFTFSIFLLEIPTGVVADRFGRRSSLILASIVGVIAPIVYVSYANFWIFALGEFLWAISYSLLSGADSALIYDSLKACGKEKDSKKVFARIGSVGLIGILTAAPLGSLIAEYWGLRATMFLISIPMAIAVLIGLSFKEPKFKSNEEKKGYFENIREGIIYVKDHKHLKVLILDYVPTASLAFFLIWVYQYVLQQYNVPIFWFGFVHAGLVISQIIMLNNLSLFEKIFGGKKNYLRLTAFLVGALFWIVAFVNNVYIAIISFFLIAAFGITRKEIYKSYLNKFIDSHNRATVLSTISMIYSLTQAMNNVILGRIVEANLKLGLFIAGLAIILFSVISRIEEEHLID